MKRSDVFEAMFTVVRSANQRYEERDDHASAFSSALTMSSVASSLFGFESPEHLVIESWASPGTPSSFVGPLAVQP